MANQRYQNPKTICEILDTCKNIAVVGLSPKSDRPSYGVSSYMMECGYKIIPVNPVVREIFGLSCYPDLLSVPDSIDLVNIFRKSEDVLPIVEEAISKNARAIWMQLGVVNELAAERALAAGLLVVMDKCLMIEHLNNKQNKESATAS